MNDLTRRVLDADTRLTREDGTIPSDQWDDAVMELLDAAPILARQIEAVEALADRLESEGDRVESRGGGFTARAFAAIRATDAALIRDALTEAAKETP